MHLPSIVPNTHLYPSLQLHAPLVAVPVPKLVFGQAKQTLPIMTFVAVGQVAVVDLQLFSEEDQRKPVLQAQEAEEAEKPLVLTSLLHGVQAPLIVIDFVGSQRSQPKVIGSKIFPFVQVVWTHFKVIGFQV